MWVREIDPKEHNDPFIWCIKFDIMKLYNISRQFKISADTHGYIRLTSRGKCLCKTVAVWIEIHSRTLFYAVIDIFAKLELGRKNREGKVLIWTYDDIMSNAHSQYIHIRAHIHIYTLHRDYLYINVPAHAVLLEISMIIDVGRRSSGCIGWNRSAADSVFNNKFDVPVVIVRTDKQRKWSYWPNFSLHSLYRWRERRSTRKRIQKRECFATIDSGELNFLSYVMQRIKPYLFSRRLFGQCKKLIFPKQKCNYN